jgi:hypothetical protein
MIRAARLEVPLYEEVEADTTATNQGLLVVVLGSLATGIGSAIGTGMSGSGNPSGGLISGVISALISWAVWSYVVYLVGTRFVGGTATYGEMLRTLGFAEAPSILLILNFIPVLGQLLSLIVFIWTIVTGFIATRQALDIDNGKTVLAIVLGIVALIVVFAVLSAIFGAIFGLGYLVGRAY